MLRNIKLGLLIGFVILVALAVIKDKIFDTPEKSKHQIEVFLGKSAKKDLVFNIFGSNKELVYKMYYWSLIPLGEFKFVTKVDDLGNQFSLQATTDKSFAEKIIKANARVTSYFSKNIQLPYKYEERTEVKGKVKTKEIIFDQANLITTREDKKFKIPTDTYDPVSAFVQALIMPLTKGSEQKIKMVSGEELYILKATVIKEDSGIAEVILDIKRENLTSSHGANFHVWITQDSARIPLVFKSWTPAGYASVVLDRVELEKAGKQ
jgi:hypothetical protein